MRRRKTLPYCLFLSFCSLAVQPRMLQNVSLADVSPGVDSHNDEQSER